MEDSDKLFTKKILRQIKMRQQENQALKKILDALRKDIELKNDLEDTKPNHESKNTDN